MYFKSEANALLEEIETLLSSYHGLKSKSLKYALQNRVRKSTAEMFKDMSEKELLGFKEKIESLPVFDLTVAFEPTASQLKTIGDLLPDCILDLKTDHKIVAGAVVSFNGKYKDYSFGPAYEQISTLS